MSLKIWVLVVLVTLVLAECLQGSYRERVTVGSEQRGTALTLSPVASASGVAQPTPTADRLPLSPVASASGVAQPTPTVDRLPSLSEESSRSLPDANVFGSVGPDLQGQRDTPLSRLPREYLVPLQREGVGAMGEASSRMGGDEHGDVSPTPSLVSGTSVVSDQHGEQRLRESNIPVRLVIEEIGLDRPVFSVGLDENRSPVVLKHDVGWYHYSARPGEGENIVLWGHVLRFQDTPQRAAPFAHLREVSIGSLLSLHAADGSIYTYSVQEKLYATPDEVAYILPQGREVLTLISCIGEQVVVNDSVEMTHRLVTRAVPVR
jgi:LPXTG-site transpeptidase (sortase) family protein